ncbi:GAP1-N2 domain-containing protein [Peribacillus sp. JNUCC 23]
MKIEQLYYTSAKRGISNGSGFQVYSMSEGITRTEISEIQNLVGYVPPSNLPSRPTDEEIQNLFPKSYTFFTLSTGRYGVFQSSYVGKDYSERYGNYFSHVLVFDGELPNYSMEYYRSSIFKEKLTVEEENSLEAPQPLATLESIPKNPKLSFDRIGQFLNEGSRTNDLTSILSMLIDHTIVGKRFMIIDDREHLPYWYAAIQYSLPKELANQVTFTTYTHNPDKNPALICSTMTLGTRYTSTHANHSPYFLFDFQNRSILQVDHISAYARYAAETLRERKSRQSLFTIIQQSSITTISKELDKSIAVLHFMENGISSLQMNELADTIEFVQRYGHDSLYKEIVDKLSRYWFDLEHLQEDLLELSLEHASTITLFLLEGAERTKRKEHWEIALTFFFHTVDQFLLDAQLPEEINQVISYYEDIQGRSVSTTSFAEKAIQPDRLSNLAYLHTEPNIYKVQFYFTSLIGHIRELNKEPLEYQQKQTLYILFKLVMKGNGTYKKEALESLHTIPSTFVQIITIYYQDISNMQSQLKTNLERAFQTLLVTMKDNPNWTNVTLKLLAKEEMGKRLILQSFYNELDDTNQPIQLLESYYQNVFTKISLLDTDLQKLVMKTMQNVGGKGQLQEQFPQFLKSQFLAYIDNHQLQQIVDSFEETIVFSNLDETKLKFLQTVKQVKDERKLHSKTNILPLIDFTMKLRTGGKPAVESQPAVVEILTSFPPKRYKDYLEWSLPFYLSPGLKENDRVQVLNMLYVVDMVELFWEALAYHPNIKNKVHVESMQTFILYALSKRRTEAMLDVNNKFDYSMVRYFQQNQSGFKKINEWMLQQSSYKKGHVLKERWEKIREKTFERGGSSKLKSSLLSKIKNLF